MAEYSDALRNIKNDETNFYHKEFYIPNFGTFAVKTHRGHKVKLNPREDDGEVVNLPDYKMLRFKPDDKFKSDILMTDLPLESLDLVNDANTNDKK